MKKLIIGLMLLFSHTSFAGECADVTANAKEVVKSYLKNLSNPTVNSVSLAMEALNLIELVEGKEIERHSDAKAYEAFEEKFREAYSADAVFLREAIVNIKNQCIKY